MFSFKNEGDVVEVPFVSGGDGAVGYVDEGEYDDDVGGDEDVIAEGEGDAVEMEAVDEQEEGGGEEEGVAEGALKELEEALGVGKQGKNIVSCCKFMHTETL